MRFWRLCEKRDFSLFAFLCGFWLAAGFGAQMVQANPEDDSISSDGLAAEAKANEEAGRFKECGTLFAAAADASPRHLYHAQRLFNAGRCFGNAGLIGNMIESLESLLKKHPKDFLVQQALIQVASGYEHLASYSEAATSYEKFVQLHPAVDDAASALRKAIQFRIGLGELDQALDDMRNFVRYYANRRPLEAAEVDFEMSAIFEQQDNVDKVVQHLKAYLAKWGLRGGVDRQILAHFKLGEIAWNKSCPRQRVHGSCVSVEEVPTGQASNNECPSPRSANLTVYDRGPRLEKEGQEHFKQVVKLWDADYEGRWLRRNFPNPSEAAVREDAVRFAVAGAAFYRAEQVYEAFLKVKAPSGILIEQPTAFDSRQEAMRRIRRSEESLRKFQSYRDAKSKLADRLAGPSKDKMGLYDLVLDYHVDYWSVAAFARIGLVYKESANQLHALKIPKELQEQDEWGNRPRKIFCDSLADTAKPFDSKAVFCFGLCLRATSEASSFSDWSTLCEGELNQLRPKEYPLPVEAMPDPSLLSIPIAPAALISKLPEPVDVASGQE